MKTCVVTVSIGREWEKISAVSDPTIRTWAARIGADRVVIDKPQFPTPYRAYEKLQVRDLLDRYDRIAVVDADILIHPRAPNVFAEVPPGSFGARLTHVGEIKFFETTYVDHAARLGKPVPDHQGKYFCCGFFVCSREHREVFCDPPKWAHAFYEQTYINIRVVELGIPIHDLGLRWNCDTSRGRDEAYAVHFKRSLWRGAVEELIGAMRVRIEMWHS